MFKKTFSLEDLQETEPIEQAIEPIEQQIIEEPQNHTEPSVELENNKSDEGMERVSLNLDQSDNPVAYNLWDHPSLAPPPPPQISYQPAGKSSNYILHMFSHTVYSFSNTITH